jgi:hypothetical protein
MMKWIFGLLLLLNMVFFAVMQWGGALTVDANNPPAQAAINADKIKIVGMAAPSIPTPVTPSAPAVAITQPTPVVAPSHAAPATPPVAAPVTPPHATPPPPVVSPPRVATPSPATPPSPIAPPAPVAASVPPPEKLSCMEWGEFSGADLLRADQALVTLRLGSKLKQRIIEYTTGYWVYIPPMKKSSQVKKMLTQLKQLEIEDHFIVQEPGAWKNAISLGVFKTEASAKKYLAKLQAKGLKNANIDEHASKLKFTVFVLNRLESATASQIVALHKNFPDSEIKQIPCY